MEILDTKKCFMSPMTNADNLKQLHDIHDIFPLEERSRARFEAHLLSVAETGRSPELDFNSSLQYFSNMGDDLREWYLIRQEPEDNTSFLQYQKLVFDNWHRAQKVLPAETLGQMLSYDNFLNNKVIHEKQPQKLFKLLMKTGLISKTDATRFTQTKDSDQNLYLCLSRNPVDYLFASTNQSFGSCVNLESEHYEAYYFGLPTEMIDPNKFLCFVTQGKTTKYEMKTPKGVKAFRHFRYVSRSWMIINQDMTVGQVRAYPNKNSQDFNAMLGLAGYIPWSEDFAIRQRAMILSSTDHWRYQKPPQSMYMFQPLLDWMNQRPNHCYSDWGIHEASVKQNPRKDGHTWLKHNKYLLYHKPAYGMSYATGKPGFSLKTGFSTLPADSSDRIGIIYGLKKMCQVCGRAHDKSNVTTWDAYKSICLGCVDEVSFKCDHCRERRSVEHSRPVWSRDIAGNMVLEKFCKSCSLNNSRTCTNCEHLTTNRTTIYNGLGGDSEAHLCHICFASDDALQLVTCTECESTKFFAGHGAIYDDKEMCYNCFDEGYYECTDCNEIGDKNNECTYINDQGYVCASCEQDYIWCPNCETYFHKDQ